MTIASAVGTGGSPKRTDKQEARRKADDEEMREAR